MIAPQANLQTTLTVHGDMEESLIKYRNLLEVAEGRTPSQLAPRAETKPAGGLAGAAAKSAPAPPPPAKQASLQSSTSCCSRFTCSYRLFTCLLSMPRCGQFPQHMLLALPQHAACNTEVSFTPDSSLSHTTG